MYTLLFLACSGSEPIDTASPDDTGTSEWEHVTVAHAGFATATAHAAIGWDGRVVAIGTTWTDAGGSVPEGVRAADERGGAIWAVGIGGLHEWTGTAWDTVALPEGWSVADDVAVLPDGNVAIVHAHMDCDDCEGAIYANDLAVWDGAAWTESTPPWLTVWLDRLVVLEDGTLVAAGAGGIGWWTGSEWEVDDVPAYLVDLATDGSSVVAVGSEGTVVRGTAGALTTEAVGTEDLVGVVTADGETWVLGQTAAWVEGGAGWEERALPEGQWTGISQLDGDVAIVGWDAGPVGLGVEAGAPVERWREASLPIGGVWVDGDGAVWAAGDQAAGRWAAEVEAWTIDGSFHAMDGAASDDIVAVGNDWIGEWDGTSWTVTASPGNGALWDVAVAPDGAAFAAGTRYGDEEGGTPILLSRTAGEWVEHTGAPTSAELFINVVAFAADDVYALTFSPIELLHWDGANWSTVATDVPGDAVYMWGRAGDDLYVGGAGVQHWDGALFTDVAGAPFGVHALSGNDDSLLVSGTDGWGDEHAPFVSELRDGVWTELFRGDDTFVVAAAGDVQVVFDGAEGYRRGR